jgi:polynucleotide 5'-hydroxyl-kinase GRC3/NOL9
MWRTVVNDVLSQDFRKPLVVMIAGGTDAGKSTFCTYLANRAIAEGVTPTIVDGDIGQSDLAPPSVIGAAALGHQTSDLRDINATVFEFVGSTSPRGLESFISQRLASIVTRSCFRSDLCIVNTDGYVDNGGAQYKKMIATGIQPGIVVLLGKNLILRDFLASGPWTIIQARASSQAQKSRTVRIWRRQDQFARFIGSARLTLDPSMITFVFRGERYSLSQLHTGTVLPFQREQMEGMFVGLGSGGDIAGFGVIDNMTQDTLVVMTDIRNFDTMYLSDVRLA